MAKDSEIGRSCGAPRRRRAHGKRPTNKTYMNGEKSPTKETYTRALQKRPTHVEREPYERDLPIWQKTHELADHAED